MYKFKPHISRPLNIHELLEASGSILPGQIISLVWIIIRTVCAAYCIILSVWSVLWLFLHSPQISWITLFANFALVLNSINLTLNSLITYKVWEKSGYELLDNNISSLNMSSFNLTFEWRLTAALSHISVAGSLMMCFVYWLFVHLHKEEFEHELSISTILDIQTHLAASICVLIEFFLSLFEPKYIEGVIDILLCNTIFFIVTFIYTWVRDFTIDWDGLLDQHYIITFIILFDLFHVSLHILLAYLKNIVLYIWYIRLNRKIENNLIIPTQMHEWLFEDRDDFIPIKKSQKSITLTFGASIQQRYDKLVNLNAMKRENPDVILLLGFRKIKKTVAKPKAKTLARKW